MMKIMLSHSLFTLLGDVFTRIELGQVPHQAVANDDVSKSRYEHNEKA
jgi:hypothetical protein